MIAVYLFRRIYKSELTYSLHNVVACLTLGEIEQDAS